MRDLADIVSFTVQRSTGGTVRFGPIELGLEWYNRNVTAGLRGGYFNSFTQKRPDLPSATLACNLPGTHNGIADQLVSTSEETQCYLRYRKKTYGPDEWPLHRFGAVGFSAGIYLIGFRFEINLIEIVDFASGLIMLDPLGDDVFAEPADEPFSLSISEICSPPPYRYPENWPPGRVLKARGAGSQNTR